MNYMINTNCTECTDCTENPECLPAPPDLVTPHCLHAARCGGCQLQHISHEKQIQQKQEEVLNLLKQICNTEPKEIAPPLLGPIWNYRHKARLSVKWVKAKNKLLVGFREKNGRYVADIQSCKILHPSVGDRIEALQQLISSLSNPQSIPQIEIAVGDQCSALIFRHLADLSLEDQSQLQQFGQRYQFELYVQPKGPDTIQKIWPIQNMSSLNYVLPNHQIDIAFQPTDFTQINLSINRQMVDQVVDWLNPQLHEVLLDLFCGLGNFTLPLAKYCHQIIGIEGDSKMVTRAQHNAARNHIDNATFFATDLFEPIDQAPWSKQLFNKILLDPPRSGAQTLLNYFPRLQIHQIVYVSCNPETLMQDAKKLIQEQEFTLQKIGILDMFPHTNHVESMALFIKG
jgi:23S rRNA (uracil1939-C5)-methyltransferase